MLTSPKSVLNIFQRPLPTLPREVRTAGTATSTTGGGATSCSLGARGRGLGGGEEFGLEKTGENGENGDRILRKLSLIHGEHEFLTCFNHFQTIIFENITWQNGNPSPTKSDLNARIGESSSRKLIECSSALPNEKENHFQTIQDSRMPSCSE